MRNSVVLDLSSVLSTSTSPTLTGQLRATTIPSCHNQSMTMNLQLTKSGESNLYYDSPVASLPRWQSKLYSPSTPKNALQPVKKKIPAEHPVQATFQGTIVADDTLQPRFVLSLSVPSA